MVLLLPLAMTVATTGQRPLRLGPASALGRPRPSFLSGTNTCSLPSSHSERGLLGSAGGGWPVARFGVDFTVGPSLQCRREGPTVCSIPHRQQSQGGTHGLLSKASSPVAVAGRVHRMDEVRGQRSQPRGGVSPGGLPRSALRLRPPEAPQTQHIMEKEFREAGYSPGTRSAPSDKGGVGWAGWRAACQLHVQNKPTPMPRP